MKIEQTINQLTEQSNINLREPHEWHNTFVNTSEVHYDEETRVRVFYGQLQDEFIININKNNYLYHAELYFKYGSRLLEKFPNSNDKINDAIMNFWQRVQMKIKKEQ